MRAYIDTLVGVDAAVSIDMPYLVQKELIELLKRGRLKINNT
jgi:hypothetical protein